MSEYLELAKVFTAAVTTGVIGTAGYVIARGLGERTKLQFAENNIVSVRNQLEIPKVVREIVDENDRIGSIFIADGERAVIALPEDGMVGDNKAKRIHQETFHLRHDALVLNYSMALRNHLTEPQKIYDIAKHPEPMSDFSDRSVKKMVEICRGAWVDNPERKRTDLYMRQNKNTEILKEAHTVMIETLKSLADESLYPEEGHIQSRDVIAVKYLGDDEKSHIVVIPTNVEQHGVLTKIYGEGVEHPKDVLDAISEHYRENLYPDGTIYTPEAMERRLALFHGDIPQDQMSIS